MRRSLLSVNEDIGSCVGVLIHVVQSDCRRQSVTATILRVQQMPKSAPIQFLVRSYSAHIQSLHGSRSVHIQLIFSSYLVPAPSFSTSYSAPTQSLHHSYSARVLLILCSYSAPIRFLSSSRPNSSEFLLSPNSVPTPILNRDCVGTEKS